MIDENEFKKFEAMLIDSLSIAEGWESMTNEIEIYQKIRSLVIGSFECTLSIMPPQVKANVEISVDKLKNSGYLFEFEDLTSFLIFAQILSTGLLSNLHDKKIQDYAAPHKVVGILDGVVRLNENCCYSENNLTKMGAAFNLGLFKMKVLMETIDWKMGWSDE
ncbi:MAG: hypothetical protein WCW04_00085 [Candidatus Paceibacterota bacterium]|jgi:hypothetical protein